MTQTSGRLRDPGLTARRVARARRRRRPRRPPPNQPAPQPSADAIADLGEHARPDSSGRSAGRRSQYLAADRSTTSTGRCSRAHRAVGQGGTSACGDTRRAASSPTPRPSAGRLLPWSGTVSSSGVPIRSTDGPACSSRPRKPLPSTPTTTRVRNEYLAHMLRNWSDDDCRQFATLMAALCRGCFPPAVRRFRRSSPTRASRPGVYRTA